MSNFKCEHCGAICYDTQDGYITGCQHYPVEKTKKSEGLEWTVRTPGGGVKKVRLPQTMTIIPGN